jgi:hypothetical protein
MTRNITIGLILIVLATAIGFVGQWAAASEGRQASHEEAAVITLWRQRCTAEVTTKESRNCTRPTLIEELAVQQKLRAVDSPSNRCISANSPDGMAVAFTIASECASCGPMWRFSTVLDRTAERRIHR